MKEKIIKLIEDFNKKENPFQDAPIEYNCVKVKTTYARSLYKLRFKDFHTPLIVKRNEIENLLRALDAYKEEEILTHGLISQEHSIIVFTDINITVIIAVLNSESLLT
jgi:hypothetical protein